MLKMLTVVGSSLAVAFVAASPPAAPAASRPHVQQVGMTIRAGDLASTPNIALAPRVPVRITVTNYTREFHTFTVPGLGLSELIYPASKHHPRKTTFTFTAYKWGAFHWHCVICPSGQHRRPHTMGGILYLIINPSVLP